MVRNFSNTEAAIILRQNLSEELIHVPLLLHGSKASGPNIHSEPFSLVDLAPTLMDALGIPAPEALFVGLACGHNRMNEHAEAEPQSWNL